ncbi:MAG: hypothetical protein PHI37_02745 [Candidatus Gracilibacteria bacterium]|nr:hypothetical protein [Candidatus Gracilibacteria bacterium]
MNLGTGIGEEDDDRTINGQIHTEEGDEGVLNNNDDRTLTHQINTEAKGIKENVISLI